MPRKDGSLTSHEMGQIADAINERVRDPQDPCPNCGQIPSEVLPKLGRVLLYSTPGHALASQYLPTGVTVCMHCGFVRHFLLELIKVDFTDATVVDEPGSAAAPAGEVKNDG